MPLRLWISSSSLHRLPSPTAPSAISLPRRPALHRINTSLRYGLRAQRTCCDLPIYLYRTSLRRLASTPHGTLRTSSRDDAAPQPLRTGKSTENLPQIEENINLDRNLRILHPDGWPRCGLRPVWMDRDSPVKRDSRSRQTRYLQLYISGLLNAYRI